MKPYVKFAVAAVALLVVLVLAAHTAILFLPIGGKIITNDELAYLLDKEDAYLVDLRETDDFITGHIPAAKSIPHAELESRMSEIPNDRQVVLTCYVGMLSALDAQRLNKAGYQVLRVRSGMSKWEGVIETWR